MRLPEVVIPERLAFRAFLEHDLGAQVKFLTDEKATKYRTFTGEEKTAAGAENLLAVLMDSYAT